MTHALRIIVADDEPEIREHFQRLLERLGHQVVAAVDNGNSLVSESARLAPDLLISDVRMPQLDGDKAVREIWKTREIPAILISAYPPPVSQEPVDHRWSYLSKPVRRNDLEAAILAAVPDH
jgi:two-component system, response regulator PdtaR